MTATYDAEYIFASSRLTYNGEADDTVGTDTPPDAVASVVRSSPTIATAPRSAAISSAPRPRIAATAPRPR